jgi:uncharacterized protein DUF5916/cellulose/xylan binding protein with CBM9 domain
MRTLAFIATLAPLVAWAQPHVRAVRVSQSPKLDGKLDDPAWSAAAPIDSFVQKFPKEGAAPSEQTTIRVIYDADAIWVGVDCRQRTAAIVGRLTRRDRPIESDSITIDFDSRRSGTNAFEFAVNAGGVLSDSIRFNDTDESSDWDENWDARVNRSSDGWSAEFRIPLRILRFDAHLPVQSWGFQARRYISARQETDEWAFIPRTVAGEVSHYGKLDDLRALEPPSPFELRPFAVGRVRHRDAASAMLASGWDASGSVGLDLKWHVTQNLTLDGTINPDFGQVEADQVLLNLTTYEIFFPEKRPFFLEGVDVFATPMQLLYTRRIGLAPAAPALRTGAPFNEQLVDLPTPSTIYGAAKLVGVVGKLTVGVLSALTARNTIEAQLGSIRLSRIAEPMSLFDVLRLRWAAGKNLDIGLTATATNRFEPSGLYPLRPNGSSQYALCPDGSLVGVNDRCFHDSYVVGPDVRWRSPSGDYVVNAQAIVSTVANGPPRQFPDGNWIRPGDVGWGGYFDFSKQGGKHWLFEIEDDIASRQLDYNDLGYMLRQNLNHIDLIGEYRTTEPWGKTLETHWRAEFYDRENFSGLNLARGYQLNTNGRFSNFWGWFAELHYRERHFDDREVGDGTALEREGLIGLELEFHTDARRRVYFELFTQAQPIFNGLHVEADGKLTVRALPQLDFDLLPTGSYDFGEPRYAGPGANPGESLFGKLTAASVGATLRATYTFTPRLTLQLYAQLFLAYKHYDQFSVFTAAPGQLGPAVHLANLRPTTQFPSVNPDLEEGVFNLNVVLRWEYRLGSTLYFVYTRSQAPDLTLMTGESARLDLGAIRRGPAADVLLLKLTYWWG